MNKVFFSSKSTMWATPQDFFDRLNEQYHFTTDVCAVAENACWMNPPYGKNQTNKWVAKAYQESRKNCIVVALLPVRTDTKWFHQFIYNKRGVTIKFINRRLKFGNSKHPAPFPSMIVIFGSRK